MPKQAGRRYPYAYLPVFDYVVRAVPLAGSKYTVLSADAPSGAITITASMNLATWGENLALTVRAESEAWTRVDLVVAMKFGLVDWGQRGRDIRDVFRAIDSVLPGGQSVDAESARLLGDVAPSPVAPTSAPPTTAPPFAAPVAPQLPPADWHADPQGRHELRYWDGTAWSEHVSNNGVTATDPVT
jgi:hypothetical protein